MRRPEPKKRNNPETQVQREIVNEIRSHFGKLIVFHTPNGGRRNIKEASAMRANGVLAGIPDLCVINEYGEHAWIEVKAPGKLKNVSDNQQKILNEFSSRGINAVVVDSKQGALESLSQWGWIDLDER